MPEYEWRVEVKMREAELVMAVARWGMKKECKFGCRNFD